LHLIEKNVSAKKYAVFVIVESSFITNNHFRRFYSLIFDQVIENLWINIFNLIYEIQCHSKS
ncbi:hypothetical protein, partial [Acinetobacter baumannii]|uniref:hypothetical protein n=1 Tax=Acinetobacter baumannii TaxID=470 RepID=UPI0022B3FF1F